MSPRSPSARPSLRQPLAAWLIGSLLVLLPFEPRFGLPLAGLIITPQEGLALAAIGAWLASRPRLADLPRNLLLGAGGLLCCLALAALLAPLERGEALKFTARQGLGAALGVACAALLRQTGPAMARRWLLALLIGAGLAALHGLADLLGWPWATALTPLFRAQPALVGSLTRLSGPFSYANIAAMYFEALTPIGLILAAILLPPRLRPFAVACLGLLWFALLFSYSRAALASGLLILIALPLFAAYRLGRTAPRHLHMLSGGLLLTTALLIALLPALRLRLFVPDVQRWFRAEYAAAPLPTLQTGALYSVPIWLANRGPAAWNPQSDFPVMLAYHWYRADGQLFDFEGLRSPLPRAVGPGEALLLEATLRAPSLAGDYLLEWDLLRERGGGWFSFDGAPTLRVPVQVAGPASNPSPDERLPDRPQGPVAALELDPPSPARRALWGAALQLWAERPMLGIGPDTFRLRYGPLLGIVPWDERIHTNNLYLELLVGAGLLGIVGFTWFVWRAVWPLLRAAWRGPAPNQLGRWWLIVALSAASLTFFVHGLVDVFLAYTPTYMLWWLLLAIGHGLLPHREGT